MKTKISEAKASHFVCRQFYVTFQFDQWTEMTAVFLTSVDWWDDDQLQPLHCASKLLLVILAFAGLFYGSPIA